MKMLLAGLIAIGLIAGPAAAQRNRDSMPGETGTRLGRTDRNDGAEYGMRFARCIAGYKRREAVAWIATTPGTPESEAAYGAMVPFRDNRCVSIGGYSIGGQSLNMPEQIMRGYIAQNLYLDRFRDGPPSIPDAGGEIPVEVYNARVTGAADTESEIVRIFGECMAMRYPSEIDALVRTGVESAEESTAIGSLVSNMSPCLWNGQSIQFSRESLRAALADALYRTAIATPLVEASR